MRVRKSYQPREPDDSPRALMEAKFGDSFAQNDAAHSAREVIFEGADRGEIQDSLGPPVETHYARSMPLKNVNEESAWCRVDI